MSKRQNAFTLIELLVVLAIVGTFMGMFLVSTALKRDERHALVQGAAAELASTLRQARAYAMERNVVTAVSFNIENAPGSSGWTLNNRSGGHWYQILGPARAKLAAGMRNDGHFPFPRARFRQSTGTYQGGNANDAPFRYYLEAIDSAWHGDRHILPKGKVRFLAVGDQDNGHRYGNDGAYQPGGSDFFYPRPWFGRWDEANKRLYPWGGYHPEFKDFFVNNAADLQRTGLDGTTPASFTGFYYEGKDGPISGCVNPHDRGILDDTNGDLRFKQSGVDADDQAQLFPLYHEGEPRPLIDARWLDLYLIFNPDGTVYWGPPLSARQEWSQGLDGDLYVFGADTFSTIHDNIHRIGPGERKSHLSTVTPYTMREVTNYDAHTGAFYITLGADVSAQDDPDQGRYPSVQAAIDALLPMCRVYVTPSGEIGWFAVKRTAPAGTTWDPLVTPDAWTTQSFLSTHYPDGTLREADYRPRGQPVTDFLVPEMLTQANWWMP